MYHKGWIDSELFEEWLKNTSLLTYHQFDQYCYFSMATPHTTSPL